MFCDIRTGRTAIYYTARTEKFLMVYHRPDILTGNPRQEGLLWTT
jgi:hypothetical protein